MLELFFLIKFCNCLGCVELILLLIFKLFGWLLIIFILVFKFKKIFWVEVVVVLFVVFNVIFIFFKLILVDFINFLYFWSFLG